MTTAPTPTTDGPPWPRALPVGPIGRLGRWTATHFRTVVATWVLLAAGLSFVAPRVETALSGAGWEVTGSESVHARQLIDEHFGGAGSYGLTVVVHSSRRSVSDPAFQRALRGVENILKRSPAVTTVAPPRPGVSISPDRRTA